MMIKFALIVLALVLNLSNPVLAQSFKFVAIGDMPYNIPDDYIRYERLISKINSIHPSFSLFVGDTKSGSTPCSSEYNNIVRDYFNKFSAPLIYSIGDNEWTDCHRTLAGSFDPIERLQNIRNTFFQTNLSFGKNKLQLTRQADVNPKYSQYVENSYWVKNNFLFVNLHIPGSNNNFERNETAKEFYARNEANLSWIGNAFLLAEKNHYAGIIFFYQADMFYTPTQATDSNSGYRDTLQAFSKHSQEFKKSVLLVHGDSHRLIVDQPLKTEDQRQTVENVIRLEVMGADQVQAVEITVDPNSEQPFGFHPIIMRENMALPKSKD